MKLRRIAAILTTLFLSCMSVALLGAQPFTDDKAVDATNIILKDVKKIVPNGHYPRISPDGQSIAYLVTTDLPETVNLTSPLPKQRSTLWLLDAASRKKRQILDIGVSNHGFGARSIAWSPDSRRLAICTGEGILEIFDLDQKKRIKLPIELVCSDLRWSSDGTRLFSRWGGTLDFGPSHQLINLDTLQIDSRVESAYLVDHASEFGIVIHPNLRFYVQTDESTPKRSEFLDLSEMGSRKSGQLFVEQRGQSEYFRKLLYKASPVISGSINITPNLSFIVFETNDGIYRADITVDPKPPARVFESYLAVDDLVSSETKHSIRGIFFDGSSNPLPYRAWMIQECLAGSITGQVYEPKINPLNGKTVGSADTLKADVVLLLDDDDPSSLRVFDERQPIKEGDVITNISCTSGEANNVSVSWAGLWSLVGPPVSPQKTGGVIPLLSGRWKVEWANNTLSGFKPGGEYLMSVEQTGADLRGTFQEVPQTGNTLLRGNINGRLQGRTIDFSKRYEGTPDQAVEVIGSLWLDGKHASGSWRTSAMSGLWFMSPSADQVQISNAASPHRVTTIMPTSTSPVFEQVNPVERNGIRILFTDSSSNPAIDNPISRLTLGLTEAVLSPAIGDRLLGFRLSDCQLQQQVMRCVLSVFFAGNAWPDQTGVEILKDGTGGTFLGSNSTVRLEKSAVFSFDKRKQDRQVTQPVAFVTSKPLELKDTLPDFTITFRIDEGKPQAVKFMEAVEFAPAAGGSPR